MVVVFMIMVIGQYGYEVNNHLQSRWLEEWAPKRGPHVSRDPLPFFRGLLDTSRIF
jgi:hypothetical protein